MKMLILCVRDIQADVYGTPFFVTSRGGAIRSFGDQVNDPEKGGALHRHPEDFELYELGLFGDGDAHFELHAKPLQIAVAKNFVK